MKTIKSIAALTALALATGLPVQAEDTDIFLNPPGAAGGANIMVILDTAAAMNGQITDLDGEPRKKYEVVGNVLKAMLTPNSLSVLRSIMDAKLIVTEINPGCTKPTPANPSGTKTSCACSNFGWIADPLKPTTHCKLNPTRATELNGLINGANLGLTLMRGNETSGDGDTKGGYIAYTLQSMAIQANRDELQAKLTGIVPQGNGSMYASAMNEAYRYMMSMPSLVGFEGSKAKAYSLTRLVGYDRRACNKNNPNAICSYSPPARYSGPSVAASCSNAIIFIGTGTPGSGNVERDGPALANLGGNPSVINGGAGNDDQNMIDEYARFFLSTDISPTLSGKQALETYSVMIETGDITKAPADKAANLMRSVARQGGGEDHFFLSKNGIDIIEAIAAILSKVQAKNAIFASAAIPANVNVRGENLNQVYFPLFRPDADAYPRWYGNLKEFQFAVNPVTKSLYLASADAAKTSAKTGGTDILADNAVSFWTQPSNFWNFAPSGEPKSGSDSPDGPVVEKGGAAQMAREQFANTTLQANRKVYTCIGCLANPPVSIPLVDATGAEATAFKIGNISLTDVALGFPGDATGRSNIISWCRGQDLKNENNTALAPNLLTTDVRASLYGDVVHSLPAVINYNRNSTCQSPDTNDVYVYYGSNDGFFKATKGGDNAAGTNGGKEQWAFIAEEHFGKLKRLYDNGPTDVITTANPKPYFFDGSVGRHITYAVTNCPDGTTFRKVTKASIFLSMRRGGRQIYALDVTDPVAPKFMWKITNATTGFAELGDTWSEPQGVTINLGGTPTPVVIFAGGYDKPVDDILNVDITAADASGVTTGTGASSTTTNRTRGRAIYVVRADNGTLVWRGTSPSSAGACASPTCLSVTGMDYSIPSDIAIVDRDLDGLAERLYFGDTGGNVWRANIGDANPGNWSVYKLADLAESSPASARRKFLFPPEVVASTDFDMVLIGSGDREQPFDTSVSNQFYGLRDSNDTLAPPITHGPELVELTSAYLANGIPSSILTDTARGWFYQLTSPGEKVVNAAVTVDGITYFGTNLPTPATCEGNLGEKRLYTFNYLTGKTSQQPDPATGVVNAYSVLPGGGYLPTGVPFVVTIDGKKYAGIMFGTDLTPTGSALLERRVRTYWFQGIDQ